MADYTDVLNALEQVDIKNKIGKKDLARLFKTFGKRFTNAWKLVEEGRVKKYIFKPSGRVVWIVTGKNRDYEVIPKAGFCSCDDFYFAVIDGRAYICQHLLSQKLAESLGLVDAIEEDDKLFNPLMEEWKKP